jgi:ubiquinone/menaquinone biosynthesis C-methylase UbiE
MINEDRATVEGFGDEWTRFDNAALSATEHFAVFTQYFASFPWDTLPRDSVGFDAGCGSGRWALLVAERIGTLHCVDASAQALDVARRLLSAKSNCVSIRLRYRNCPSQRVPWISATAWVCCITRLIPNMGCARVLPR